MSALTEVVAVLGPLDYPTMGRIPDNVTGLTLVVMVASVEHNAALAMRHRDWTLNVLVLSPLQDPEKADLELEGAIDEVLDLIDAAQPLRWTTSERVVLDENFNAHRISVVITMQPEEGAQP
jgi:hypothetical protein